MRKNYISTSHDKINLAITTVLLLIIFDRLTKLFFLHAIAPGQSIPVIKNVFHFTLVFNTGIAFGLFKDKGWLFIAVSAIVSIFIVIYIYLGRNDPKIRLIDILALSLILGGALGNLIDRLLFGHVIDFIDFRIWPVFNIADSAITVGAFILLIRCIPLFAK